LGVYRHLFHVRQIAFPLPNCFTVQPENFGHFTVYLLALFLLPLFSSSAAIISCLGNIQGIWQHREGLSPTFEFLGGSSLWKAAYVLPVKTLGFPLNFPACRKCW